MMERCISLQRDGLEDDEVVFHYVCVYIQLLVKTRLLLNFLPFTSNICMDLLNSCSESFFMHFFRNW